MSLRLDQYSVAVEAHAFETLTKLADQSGENLAGHLRVKQKAVRLVAVPIRLKGGFLRRRQRDRIFRQIEDIAMPMGGDEFRRQSAQQAILFGGVMQPDGIPSDFPLLAAADLSAEGRRQ